VIASAAASAAILLVRAQEAWEPVLFSGLIPLLGVGAILWLIIWAIKEPPEEERPEDENHSPPGLDDDGHEGPLS
jgi:hypothetical protein